MGPSIEHMVRAPRRLPRQPRRLRQEVARSGEWSALSQGEGGGSGGATGWWISPRGGQQRRRGEAVLGGRGGGRYAWVWVLEGVFGSELSLALAWWTEANLARGELNRRQWQIGGWQAASRCRSQKREGGLS